LAEPEEPNPNGGGSEKKNELLLRNVQLRKNQKEMCQEKASSNTLGVFDERTTPKLIRTQFRASKH